MARWAWRSARFRAPFLISIGVPPAAASAGVHTAETFTTAVSGISHVAHRNVDWRLFFRIVIPGVIGGVLGAYVLTQINADIAKPFVLAYLTALGVYLFYRGVMHRHTERRPKIVEPLGLVGGFLDAAGGGGWGAIVTSNLLVQGSNPRKTIGTVNTAEFFLTVPPLRDLHRHARLGRRSPSRPSAC